MCSPSGRGKKGAWKRVYVVHKSAFKDFRSILVAQRQTQPYEVCETHNQSSSSWIPHLSSGEIWFESRELEGRTNGRAKPAGAKLEEEKKMKKEDDGPHSKNGNNSKKPQKGGLGLGLGFY